MGTHRGGGFVCLRSCTAGLSLRYCFCLGSEGFGRGGEVVYTLPWLPSFFLGGGGEEGFQSFDEQPCYNKLWVVSLWSDKVGELGGCGCVLRVGSVDEIPSLKPHLRVSSGAWPWSCLLFFFSFL